MIIGSDHKTCEDENECLREPPPCSHTCVDLEGSFACTCPVTMELEHDNRTCCEIGKCKRPLSAEGQYSSSEKWVITVSVLGVVIVVILVVVIWRMLKRNMSTSEKVLRAIKQGDPVTPDVFYNPNTESMELETRGMGAETSVSKAEPYQTFHRKNVKSYGTEDEMAYTKEL